MKLPAEIRNKIYRLVLLTQNVSTDIATVDHTCRTSNEIGRGFSKSLLSDGVAVGTIRCEPWRTYTSAYQISVLRANRQTYCEAWGIFQLENFWTFVEVNKPGVGKELKDRGFPIKTGVDLRRYVKFPVMQVMAIFPSLEGQQQRDTFLVAAVHLKQLVRVLWTANGASEMKVTIDVQPPPTNNSPSEGYLLRPFFKLRNIKELVVFGVSERRYIDELTRAITTMDGINQALNELTAGVKNLQRYIMEKRWGHAIAQAEKHSMLMFDCQMVYGNRLRGIGCSLSIQAIIARWHDENEIEIATAIGLAEVTFYLRDFDSTIRFANVAFGHANNAICDTATVMSALSLPIDLQIPSHTNILPSVAETKCIIHLIRARAHMGLQQAQLAFDDIRSAREYMPTSMMLVSVTEACQEMFGPIPCFPPLTDSSYWQ